MRIVCPIKRVPDTAAEKHIDADTMTVDRDASDPVLNANDEWAVEEALRIKERGVDATITALCMGPDNARSTVLKALSYGLDDAVHVADDALAGSDANATAKVLAAALSSLDFDLVLMGNQSSDARTTLVPAMVAEYLGVPALTFVKHLDVDGETLTAHRETSTGHMEVQASVPAVVSVVEAINDPRYPSFKGIMAAKKKPVAVRDLAALHLEADDVGATGSATEVVDVQPRPPKEAGRKVEDDGSGAAGADAIVEWLVEQRLL